MKTQNCFGRFLPAALVINFALALPRCAFAQGRLAPPGKPTRTVKTLTQSEQRAPSPALPFVLTSSGSCYRTTHLTGVSGANGINISASAAAPDLNGPALIGVPGSANDAQITHITQNCCRYSHGSGFGLQASDIAVVCRSCSNSGMGSSACIADSNRLASVTTKINHKYNMP